MIKKSSLLLMLFIVISIDAMEKKPTEITPLNLQGLSNDPTANTLPTTPRTLATLLTPRSAEKMNRENNSQCEPCARCWYYLCCLPVYYCCLKDLKIETNESN